MNNSENFYKNLEGFSPFEKFAVMTAYKRVPDDWAISVADVQNSTGHIEAGKYKDVNAVGAASIAAVINAIRPLIIPFVFGGDGAAFCYPILYKSKIESALLAAKILALKEFNITLIIGTIAVKELRKLNTDVLVAKYRPSEYYQQAMFSGNGMTLAEELIKRETTYRVDETKTEAVGNFDGFECRWNEIPSPNEETISLLVQSLIPINESELLYRKLNKSIIEIYGAEVEHHPIRKDHLSLSFSFTKLFTETRIRNRIADKLKRFRYLIQLILLNAVGNWFMTKKKKTKNTDWGKYKDRLITNTDYRKFDDSLRMVISGSRSQRNQLIELLQSLHNEKKIVFGIHSSPASLITCVVENYETEHIHFLDGSNGGYAYAAKELKKQLQEIST